MNYNEIEGSKTPIKAWNKFVSFEPQAIDQLKNLASLPFIFKHIAAMPDTHWGMGATIGSVIATVDAIVPAAVGVDIGCGLSAQRCAIKGEDLPGDLLPLRTLIEKGVPHGRTDNGGDNDRGSWGSKEPVFITEDHKTELVALKKELDIIVDKHPLLRRSSLKAFAQCGTLGTGNHFVEVCLDQEDSVWVMLHSGSRGIGNAIGRYFIEKAKEEMVRWHIALPDDDLAYLPKGSMYYDDYIEAVSWAQRFAAVNRSIMMHATLYALHAFIGKPFELNLSAVSCHHNYVSFENHFDQNVIVTRKGAVRARVNDLGIIPGSMGAKSFIVKGKGNQESFCSCSHGAGRAMSRADAKKKFTLADHALATAGVECRKDAGVIDETPAAYKNIDDVMRSQEDLVEILYTLKQIVCVKG